MFRKALLLAAGIGSRLRPLTETTPKCLLPVCGKPILAWWLENLRRHGVEETIVNTHYLADQVGRFLADWTSGPEVRASHEPELLGSAGTLAQNWDRLASDGPFFVCNADTLTNVDLSALAAAHRRGGHPMSITVFESPQPSSCGIVELDDAGTVVHFEEKPERPRSNLANGGVYALSPEIAPELPAQTPADIGYHLLPRLVGRMSAYRWRGVLHDIGTVESYEQASELWSSRGEAAA